MEKRYHTHHLALCLLLGMILGCHNGRVALFTPGNPRPSRVYPFPVAALPPEDQQALAKGIHVDDSRELDRLLEDYLS